MKRHDTCGGNSVAREEKLEKKQKVFINNLKLYKKT